MKKSGYDDEFAGAVVATGSVGGQLMPPVMGAAAFIMADTLGMKYNELLLSAIIPQSSIHGHPVPDPDEG